jgi:hypothetical protein
MAIRAYAAFCAVTALVVLAGQHRAFYRLLDAVSTPEPVIAAVTGLAGLAWYELAYAVGGGLKNVRIFLAVPWLGAGVALLASAGAMAGGRWQRRAAALHLSVALGVGGLALAVLLWRTVRGYPDPWRVIATIAFLATHAAWALRFLAGWRTERLAARAGAPA